MNEGQRALNFVALQVANEVPARLGQDGRAFPKRLGTIFSEVHDAEFYKQGSDIHGDTLGYGNHRHFAARPSCSPARGLNPFLDDLYLIGKLPFEGRSTHAGYPRSRLKWIDEERITRKNRTRQLGSD
jgi:hypothetical protein